MLKRASKYSLPNSYKNNVELIYIILRIFDNSFKTIYSEEFYYVHICKEKFSLQEIAEIVSVSETSLKDHIKKINVMACAIMESRNDIKINILK